MVGAAAAAAPKALPGNFPVGSAVPGASKGFVLFFARLFLSSFFFFHFLFYLVFFGGRILRRGEPPIEIKVQTRRVQVMPWVDNLVTDPLVGMTLVAGINHLGGIIC